MRSFIGKEIQIGTAVSGILRYTQTYRQTQDVYRDIMLLLYLYLDGEPRCKRRGGGTRGTNSLYSGKNIQNIGIRCSSWLNVPGIDYLQKSKKKLIDKCCMKIKVLGTNYLAEIVKIK